MVICDWQEKVLSSQNVLLWIFLEIRYLIWRYAELNRLLVGTGLISLNIELKQDDCTVCCGYTDVGSMISKTNALLGLLHLISKICDKQIKTRRW